LNIKSQIWQIEQISLIQVTAYLATTAHVSAGGRLRQEALLKTNNKNSQQITTA
jgi:hypothetical protein